MYREYKALYLELRVRDDGGGRASARLALPAAFPVMLTGRAAILSQRKIPTDRGGNVRCHYPLLVKNSKAFSVNGFMHM